MTADLYPAAADLPAPPACPSWCERHQLGEAEWDHVDIIGGQVAGFTRICSGAVGEVDFDEGAITVRLTRECGDDPTSQGGVYVARPRVELHAAEEICYLIAEQVPELIQLLERAARLAVTS